MHMHIPRVGINMITLNQHQIPFETAEWFPELDELQHSGQMNMMEAPRWLQDTFGFSKEQSLTIFNEWVEYKS